MARANTTYITRTVALAGASAGIATGTHSNDPGDGRRYYAAVIDDPARPFNLSDEQYMGTGPKEAERFAAGVDWCLRVLEHDPAFCALVDERQRTFWHKVHGNK
jgi:hypothetical protein